MDERYLGINAKAKSAETADTATTASKAEGLVNDRYSSEVAVVIVDITPAHYSTKTWAAPSDGIMFVNAYAVNNTGHTATVLGVNYGASLSTPESGRINALDQSVLILKEGDTIVVRSADDNSCSIDGKFFPLSQR